MRIFRSSWMNTHGVLTPCRKPAASSTLVNSHLPVVGRVGRSVHRALEVSAHPLMRSFRR
eukprot:4388879-Heterocapsa_arctica.AAC.1